MVPGNEKFHFIYDDDDDTRYSNPRSVSHPQSGKHFLFFALKFPLDTKNERRK